MKTPLVSRIIVLALGPWTPPFWAPSWRFLPIQARQSAMRPHCGVSCRPLLPGAFAGASDWVSAECFCEGLWPGFGSGRFCEELLQGFLRSLSHDLLRRLAVNVPQRKSRVCAWARVSSCNENFVFASGAGHRPATKISRLRLGRASSRNETLCCGSVNSHPVLSDGVSRSLPRRPAVSGVE